MIFNIILDYNNEILCIEYNYKINIKINVLKILKSFDVL